MHSSRALALDYKIGQFDDVPHMHIVFEDVPSLARAVVV